MTRPKPAITLLAAAVLSAALGGAVALASPNSSPDQPVPAAPAASQGELATTVEPPAPAAPVGQEPSTMAPAVTRAVTVVRAPRTTAGAPASQGAAPKAAPRVTAPRTAPRTATVASQSDQADAPTVEPVPSTDQGSSTTPGAGTPGGGSWSPDAPPPGSSPSEPDEVTPPSS